MTRQPLSRATGIAVRGLRNSSFGVTRLSARPTTTFLSPNAVAAFSFTLAHRSKLFSTNPSLSKGILPHSEDPAPPNVQPSSIKAVPAELSDEEYHELADEYMDIIYSRLEDVAEKNSEVDVEYSAGVLNVAFPNLGTYVINKQPPNKQIWLSSPKSGPKRYDYVLYGEGQAQKEDTAVGDWVYLRDGSTVNQLFLEELDIDLALPLPQ